MEFGSSSLPDFKELCRIQTRRTTILVMLGLENLLKNRRGMPPFWAQDVKKYIAVLEHSLKNKDHALPEAFLRKHGDARQAWELARGIVLQFGQLLRQWPDITEAARMLRERDIRLARPVRCGAAIKS